jgi:hypothetical protein
MTAIFAPRDSRRMISSLTPSEKYCSSGSLERLSNGNAAQQGFVPADPVQDLLEARHAAASPGLTGRRCCMEVAASTTLTPRRSARDASGVAVLRRTARDDPHDSL